jgi:signal transduction histidine kinase
MGFTTSDLSHKMKSPLSKIQHQVELIENNQGIALSNNTEITNRLSKITEIASNATIMVQKTLDEAKSTLVALESISLRDMIENALIEIEIPEKVSLINSVQLNNIDFNVTATKHLKNVFQTLITNSMDAMPEGGSIYIEVEDISGEWIIISVEDTGKGVSKADADMVLLPISATGLKGRGFGLALTNQYVQMIGGKIDPPIPGRGGVGAKFLVHLKVN